MRKSLFVVAAMVGLATPALAQTDESAVSVTVDPGCVEVGTDFTVRTTGLTPGESYRFVIEPRPEPFESGAVVEADEGGAAVLPGTIPANVEGVTGEYTWRVTSAADGQTHGSAEFRIAEVCPITEGRRGTFADDDGNPHEPFIEAIASEGITRGCNPPVNDRFCPDDSVTRIEMAAFLTRALGLEASGTNHFVDDDDRELEADVNALAGAGITLGCNPDGDRFCPDEPVTRGQMAAFLVRGFDYSEPATGDRFVDDDQSPFQGDIEALAEAGVTLGCNPPDNDRFCPDEPVARDQMASFLGRALDLAPRTPDAAAPTSDDRQSDPFPGTSGAQLEEVRAEQHAFFDRVVFEFSDAVPGWSIMLQDPPLLGDPSGLEIPIEGDALLAVAFNPAAAQWAAGDYDGPDRIDVTGGVMTEVVMYSDFEGVNSWAIGLEEEAAYVVGTLQSPARVVVDIMHG